MICLYSGWNQWNPAYTPPRYLGNWWAALYCLGLAVPTALRVLLTSYLVTCGVVFNAVVLYLLVTR